MTEAMTQLNNDILEEAKFAAWFLPSSASLGF